MRGILILATIIISTHSFAQKKKAIEYILDVDNNHRNTGWYIGIGPTYMYSNPGDYTRVDTLNSSTYYEGIYDAKGAIKWNVELAGFKILESGPIHIIDYGINYRTFSASEKYEAKLLNQPAAPNQIISGEGSLKQSFVGINFGINRLMGINRYFFLLHNLNINANYRIQHEEIFEAPLVLSPIKVPEEDIQADLSYKFGMGFRMRKGMLVLTGSIPIISNYDTTELLSRKDILHSRYHPLVFSIKYMWLRKNKGLSCPERGGARKGREKLFDGKVMKTRK